MLSKIENIICVGEGVTPREIHRKDRTDEFKETRQIIMFFAREMDPKLPWRRIAGYFGLDHATGMHANKTILNFIDSDKKFKAKINWHRSRLKAIKLDKMIAHASDIRRRLEFDALKLEEETSELNGLISQIKKELAGTNIPLEAVPNAVELAKIIEPKSFKEPIQESEPVKLIFEHSTYKGPYAETPAFTHEYKQYQHF